MTMMTLITMIACMALAAVAGGGQQDAVQLARTTASKALGIPQERFQVRTVEGAEWPDSSLGCPRGNANYMPVVTRGYRVVLEADGQAHTVHVAGSNAVLCDRPRLGGPLRQATADQLADMARRDLATRLHVPRENVQVRSVKPKTWSDASLGCPKPGFFYAEVETSGFDIELAAGGKTYRYHSDLQRVVACDE